MAAVDRQLAEMHSGENEWRRLISERKESDRREQVEAERRAAEAAEAARAPIPVPKDRLTLQREAEAIQQQDDKQRWLDLEWGPLFAQHRLRTRQNREEEERTARENRAALEAAELRERKAMGGEDAASSTFVAAANEECRRVMAEGCAADAADLLVAQQILEDMREALRQARHCEELLARNAEADRQQEEKRQAQDYAAWKASVSAARGIRKSVEEAAERASAEALLARELGMSPRRLLEQTRARAEEQKRVREFVDPIKAEQELFDTLLAKNRVVRQQERSRTQRWGVFN
eukprot:NODE_11505_length_1282_cov_8.392208.p1 GENE.NODE_11505_length_1282_cov_8.392208~~NODE_11505_length_1282_cov_8.392208.p1  ORF type:complete len:334 (-),score=85.12 NODE_11505_length_1282_cov_8.392208:279-1154(-)